MPENKDHKLLFFWRKNRFNILFWCILLFVFFNTSARAWILQQVMKTGVFNASLKSEAPADSAPEALNLMFLDENRQVIPDADLNGKVLFVNFWASWCPPCIAEMPSIQALYEQFDHKDGIKFLMVNEDNDIGKGIAYRDKRKFTWPIVTLGKKMPEELYKGVLPTTLIIDKVGRIRYRHQGFADYNSSKFIKQLETMISE